MRKLSLILAAAFLVATSGMAGTVDSLPGAGTFAFNAAPASAAVLVASR